MKSEFFEFLGFTINRNNIAFVSSLQNIFKKEKKQGHSYGFYIYFVGSENNYLCFRGYKDINKAEEDKDRLLTILLNLRIEE